jgi:hypothetical protein
MTRAINLIVIHCSATTADMDVGRDWIDDEHRKRGFAGIGYHYVIRRDGTEEVGRPESQIGAHAQGHNKDSLGVCLAGGVRRAGSKLIAESNYTPAQWAQLKRLIQRLRHKYPNAKIVGHRDLDRRKECPCFDVRDWLVREGLHDGIEWNSGTVPAKPLQQSNTVRGAVGAGVAGATGIASSLMDNADTVATAASSVSWLAEPGTILALVLLALVVGGTIVSVMGRKRVRDEEGV